MDNEKIIDKAVRDSIKELNDLLDYSVNLLPSIKITTSVRHKTIYRLNLYSGVYQRVKSIVHLLENNQANTANILLRSTWELLAASDFVSMGRGNYYLELLRALEGSMMKTQWSQIRQLRHKYPNSNTWQERWSDDIIDGRIAHASAIINKFSQKYPGVKIQQYRSLRDRLTFIDNYNIQNTPNHKALSQMDYYTVYALFSDDVHSTVYGTSKNTLITKTGVHVDLEKKGIDSLRSVLTAYSMLLNYVNMMTRLYRLSQGESIRAYRKIEKTQKDRYVALEDVSIPTI